jgi:hypothetical protein
MGILLLMSQPKEMEEEEMEIKIESALMWLCPLCSMRYGAYNEHEIYSYIYDQ